MIALLGLLVTSFVAGMTVAVITTLLLTEVKSKSLPGGSIVAAATFAFAQQQSFGMIVLCCLAGFAGWFVLHYIIVPRLK